MKEDLPIYELIIGEDQGIEVISIVDLDKYHGYPFITFTKDERD